MPCGTRLTTDASGHIYAGCGTGEVFRYNAGDPESKELLAVFPIGWFHSMVMSPDQSMIYVNTIRRLLGIDVVDGNVTTLAEFDDGLDSVPAGIAVVQIPPRIPTIGEWGMVVMVLLLLTAGTIVILRAHPVIA